MEAFELNDPLVSYSSIDDKSVYGIINLIRNGIRFPVFENFVEHSPFTMPEWSSFLHLSERTMQRYKKENSSFDSLQSERIVEIRLLYNYGQQVFGNTEYFNKWLETDNLVLGRIKPKMLLDSSFGINLLKDELSRIENGVLS
jgi:putative toxin-antitoxin system antitoxin component (TIGR02293 family)